MQNTPIDEHSEDFAQLAGLYALHVLEDDELVFFEAHRDRCERCQLMVRLDREALARVALLAPPMDPSPDFKERLMRRAADELALAHPEVTERTEPTPIDATTTSTVGVDFAARGPRRANVVPFWRRSPWMSALAAVFVVALVTAGAYTVENQTVATYSLTGTVQGSATVVVRRSGAAELDMSGVPSPDPGFVYEAWIIPAGKQPVAAGVTASGDAKLPLSGDLRGSTIAITKERGRVDQPTSTPILATVVQS